jgi:actin-like ATPase involved in cell morphogenesis
MGYRLGIDLGTTFTSAAVYSSGWPVMVGLGNRAMQIPSVLFLRPEGGFLVGEAAERRAPTDPNRVAREFKRRFGDQVPFLVGGSPYSAQALQAELLSWVVDRVTERQGGPPEHITLTHPANWGPFKQDLFRQMIRMADLEDVEVCTEPEAAATLYAARNVLTDGECIAVYDLGGGTFDAAVLRKTVAGFEVLGRPEGIELGGIDFDEAVFRHVLASLGDDLAGADDDVSFAAALARLRRECVDAKEALSSDTETTVTVTLPVLHTTTRLVREELEDMVRPTISNTISAVRRVLRSAELEPQDLSAIVLTGGSSRIPLVSQQLTAAFDRPLALDTHPKHDVALGAAIHGVPLASMTAPPPSPAPRPAPPEPQPEPDPEPAEPEPEPAEPEPEPEPEPLPPATETLVPEPEATPPEPIRSEPQPGAWHPEPAPVPRSRSRHPRAAVVIGLAVVLVIGLAITASQLLGGDAKPDSHGGESSSSSPPTSTTSRPSTSSSLPTNVMLVTGRGPSTASLYEVKIGDQPGEALNLPSAKGSSRIQAATISPDRETVVYLAGSTLHPPSTPWIWDLTSLSTPVRLFEKTSECKETYRPAFDATSDRLAFVCQKGKVANLFVMTLSDSHMQRVNTSGLKPIGDPTWVSEQQIVFLARSDSQSKELYLADPTHPDAKPMLLDSPPSGESDARPDWSSPGLLFLRTTNDNKKGQLFIRRDLSRDGVNEPLPPRDEVGGYIDSAAWSPNHSSIVLVRDDGDNHYTLWTMDANGDNPIDRDWPAETLGEPWAPAWGSR